ncbi:MAG TPA: flagellar biosynthetic protein FliR [Clostridiales bacterium]|nr:MAG: flagellar biosynthetic protein FliR [Clostridiales bacterium GWD2_32_59]HAN10594.1 flagellar biosynthetic protein FliR [Clostridiales bacterium]
MGFMTQDIYMNMEIVFLVMLRIVAFFVSAPFFSGQYVNNYIKVGLSFILANVVVSTGLVKTVSYSNDIFGYFGIGIKEVAVGLILGYIATIILNVIVMVGEMVDFQIGFSMASVMDPLSGTQMPITGNLYYFSIIALMLVTNMHYELIKAIIYSYKIVGLGVFNLTQSLFDAHMEILTDMFVTAIKMASPIIGIMLIINIGLGILVRTLPQMNMFVVGLPIKIYISLYVMILITPFTIMSFSYIFDKIDISFIKILKGMSP